MATKRLPTKATMASQAVAAGVFAARRSHTPVGDQDIAKGQGNSHHGQDDGRLSRSETPKRNLKDPKSIPEKH